MTCRNCGSRQIFRSRTRELERFVVRPFGFVPFRCMDCDVRYLRFMPTGVQRDARKIFLRALAIAVLTGVILAGVVMTFNTTPRETSAPITPPGTRALTR